MHSSVFVFGFAAKCRGPSCADECHGVIKYIQKMGEKQGGEKEKTVSECLRKETTRILTIWITFSIIQ